MGLNLISQVCYIIVYQDYGYKGDLGIRNAKSVTSLLTLPSVLCVVYFNLIVKRSLTKFNWFT